jgi:hypothetical protein
MSILSKAISGRRGRAQKVMIYAPEGFGKSTLASLFPNPLFLDIEDSTSQLDVIRLTREDLPTLKEFQSALDEVIKTRSFATVVIDTFDWLEQMILAAVIAEASNPKIHGIEDFGYGKGYTYLAEKTTLVLAQFDRVIQAGVNVVLLAHSKVSKFEPPDGAGPFDRYELKLSKHVGPLVKEWADMLLFGNWRLQVREKDKDERGEQYKTVGGKERLMYCTRTAPLDAKNRHGMSDVEKWDIGVIEKAFRSVNAPWGNAPVAAAPAPSEKPATTNGGGGAAAESQAGETPQSPNSGAAAAVTPAPVQDPDGIPGVLNPVDPELVRICEPHAAVITEYLRGQGRLAADQDWRSIDPVYAKRILKNPAGFLKIALNGKAVAA